MSIIPSPPPWADLTVRLLRDGYLFLPRLRWERGGEEIIPLRVLGQRAVAVFGPAGAEMFYQRPEIKRRHAVPGRVQKTLFGEGAVQSLDDEDHRHRKEMFMRVMSPESLKDLGALTAAKLEEHARRWSRRHEIDLMQAAGEVLMETGAEWVGLPLSSSQVRRRARQMGMMVDSFAAVGPRHWRGRLARRRAERWVTGLVEQIRRGEVRPREAAAVTLFAQHRDRHGAVLPARVAAVEILNLVRPLVAVRRLVAFTALALYEQDRTPHGEDALRRYVHEVRRYYPFAPFVGGRAEEPFTWRDVHVPAGTMVLLDIYGMSHDPHLWEKPQRFDPDRFQGRSLSPYDYVPQGGGDFRLHHRCAGEEAVITTLVEFTRFLSGRVAYEVPPQDLTIDLGRIPARVASGFVLAGLHRR